MIQKICATPWTVSIDLPFCILLLKLAWQYTYFEIEKNDSENLRDTLNRIHWFTVLHFSVKISVTIYLFRNWKKTFRKFAHDPEPYPLIYRFAFFC